MSTQPAILQTGFCLAVAVVLSFGASLEAADTQRPNIVLILADDLGWADVGCFGSESYQTPNIDRLATQGTKFTNSYAACNVCSPTRASLLTGKYPARLHLTDFIPGGGGDHPLESPAWTKHLPLEEITIAEALRPAGYVSGHFGKWHLNSTKDYRPGRPMDPASQGFDAVLTTVKPKSTDDPESDPHHVQQITDAAIGFIKAHRQRPFFCYVSHHSVHRPVIARPEVASELGQHIAPNAQQASAKYAAMVNELDESVGRIMQTLDALDLSNETLLIFTSDNGGFMGDAKDDGTSNSPLRAGKGTNFEGGVRVPTIVRLPGVTTAGSVCHEPIISNDFFATFADVANLPDSSSNGTDGVSIAPLLENSGAHLDREALFWHYPHYHSMGATPHGAVRVGPWKLIEFYEDMHSELYNLEEDLGEQHDLAAEMPGKTNELRQRLHTWREEVGAQMPVPAGS